MAAVVGATLRGWPAALGFAGVLVVYAVSECFYTAVLIPSVVAIAPQHMPGRYLGIVGFTWQAGFSIGPPVAASVLAAAQLAFPIGESAICLLLACLLIAMPQM